MSFLYPGFLFALVAVAIPVIIHLFNFRKYKRVYFTNVRLLKSVEEQNSSWQKLINRVLLLTRILAIVFLVLAFTQPYIRSNNKEINKNAVVSIYLDNSYSMEATNRNGSLLDEGRRRAKEIALSYSLNDKFQLLTSDFEGKHQRLLNREELIKALDEVKAGGNIRTLPQIIQRQKDVFLKEPQAIKYSYIVSDFQNNTISSADDSESDSTLTYRLVKLSANTISNISVDSVWFTSPIHRVGKTENLVVRLSNYGDKDAKNVPLTLTINNVQKSIATISIDAEGSKTDTLSFSGLNSGWQQGLITIKDYPIVFDDRFYFSFNVMNELPLLIINGEKENQYLNAVYRSDPFFKVVNVNSGNINYSLLSNYPFIVLNEIPDFSSGFNQQIKAYIQNGGSVFLFPSLNDKLEGLSSLLQMLGTDIPQEIIDVQAKVSKLNLQHPIFKDAFEKVPQNINLPIANRYISFSQRTNSLKRSVLDFGSGKPFIAEYKSGKGKVYLSTVPANEKASNLVRHSIFLPIMYQSALSGLQFQKLYYPIGNSQALEMPKLFVKENQRLVLKNKNFEIVPDVRQTENATNLFVADQIKEAGNYSLFKADSLIALFSFNENKSESELKYASASELKAKFKNRDFKLFEPKQTSMENEIKAEESSIQLWKVCLVLSLIFLAIEILLLRIFEKRRLQRSTV